MDKREKDIEKVKGQLANADFVARAPKEVVEEKQRQLKESETALANLKTQHAKVAALPG